MTLEQLNAIYEAADFGNNAKYKAPTTTIPTDPNAGQPPILEPLIPALPMPYINQGGDNDNGITTLKNNIGPTYNLKGLGEGINPSNNKSGIAGLFEFLQRISPMANIMKLGNNVLTNTQKYFADKKEKQRLEELAQIEQARKQKEAQAIIAAAEEQATREAATATRAMAANPDVYRNAGITSGGFASQNTGSNPSFSNKTGRGRTGYGTGGIVSL